MIDKYQPLWGSWRIEETIEQGKDGGVYRVYREEWGRRYTSAVKFMSFSIGSSDVREAQAIGIEAEAMPEYLKSLVGSIQNEIELMYKLRGNSNIVTYEDHGIYEKGEGSGWDILIRMEFLEPLPDFIKGHKIDRFEAARLGIDICKALEACAREGIIHRDIKDSSIFVSSKGEFKLGNFRMAKELLQTRWPAPVIPSPLYAAPELYKEQGYDHTADIYSLGMVMYKLVNKGRLPFLPMPPRTISVDDAEKSAAERMAGKELPPPADSGEALGVIILKACSYDKKDRYKSSYEFRQKLERFLKAEAKSAKSDSQSSDEEYVYTSTYYGIDKLSTEENEFEFGKETAAEVAAEVVEETAAEVAAEVAEETDEEIAAKVVAITGNKIKDKREDLFGSEKEVSTEIAAAGENGNTFMLKNKKNILAAVMGVAVMLLSFFLGYSLNNEPQGDSERPIASNREITGASGPVSASGATATSEIDSASGAAATSEVDAGSEIAEVLFDEAFADVAAEATEGETADAITESITGTASGGNREKPRKTSTKKQPQKNAAEPSKYLQLAADHNQAGVREYNEGRLEQAAAEFDKAVGSLDDMKKSASNCDLELYSGLRTLYSENKTRTLEKKEKVDEFFKLASECNAAGVKYYNEGSLYKSKLEFEKALKHLEEIRLLVPKYSAGGYEGLIQIYEGNLSRAKMRK